MLDLELCEAQWKLARCNHKKEDDEIISQTNLRASYDCLTDIDSLDPEIAEVANTVWTDEVKEAYRNYDPFND